MKKAVVAVFAIAMLLACTAAFAQNVSPTTYQRHGYYYNTAFNETLQKLASGTGEGSTKVYVAGWDYFYGYYSSNAGQKHGLGAKVPPHFGWTGWVIDIGSDGLGQYEGYGPLLGANYLLDIPNGYYALYYSFGYYGVTGDYYYLLDYLQPGLAPAKGEPAKRPAPSLPKIDTTKVATR